MRGLWQLTHLTLTTDARRAGSHAIRFGLAIVLYLAVVVASWSPWRSAGGLPLFHAQLLITAFYLTINAIFGFSQEISEEKEDGTLGLMRLADISPLSIILGKISGRLVDSGLMIAIQCPFTIVAVTLGGVSWAQVSAAYATLATYLWLLATLGIAAAVMRPTGAGAARVTALFIAFYTLPPFLEFTVLKRWGGLVGDYQFFSLPFRLTAITESSFNGSAWSVATAFGIVGGVLFLLVAWLAFDGLTLGQNRLPRPAWISPRWISPTQRNSRRAWSNPIVWREFLFLTGGVPWLSVRIVGHLVILLMMILVQDTIGHVFAWASIFCGVYALIDGTWLASRLFRDEIRDRTWSSLVQTPHSVARLAFQKSYGWILGLAPSIIFPYLMILMTVTFHENTRAELATELVIGSITIGLSVVAYLHLLVLMSLYHGWKATPLTLTITVAIGWVYVQTVFTSRLDLMLRCALFCGTCLALSTVMVGLQVLIIRRLEYLAETA